MKDNRLTRDEIFGTIIMLLMFVGGVLVVAALGAGIVGGIAALFGFPWIIPAIVGAVLAVGAWLAVLANLSR